MIGRHSGPGHLAGQWVEQAEHDYHAAMQLLHSDDPEKPFYVICFHAQQCAEKYLKALCIFGRKPVPRSHDLLELLPLLPDAIRLSLSPEELAELNPFAVEVRYPGVSENVTREEALRAIDICGKIRSVGAEFFAKTIP